MGRATSCSRGDWRCCHFLPIHARSLSHSPLPCFCTRVTIFVLVSAGRCGVTATARFEWVGSCGPLELSLVVGGAERCTVPASQFPSAGHGGCCWSREITRVCDCLYGWVDPLLPEAGPSNLNPAPGRTGPFFTLHFGWKAETGGGDVNLHRGINVCDVWAQTRSQGTTRQHQ